jgi:hypothetical protein
MRPDTLPTTVHRTTADTAPKDTQLTTLTSPAARSTPMHLQLNVTPGCTTRLSDISDALNISAIRLGQALYALHLRDQVLPTHEATDRGLGRRWYAGCQYLIEWHISGITEVVTAHYDSIGWPSKPKPKASTPSCRTRRGAGR